MIKVGCCGFPTFMKKYFESFSLIELNSTFYQYPQEKTVAGWHDKASKDFEFTVKAHQDISHKAMLKINELSLQAFERMKQICKTLSSKILLIQTPGSLRPDKLDGAEKFFRKINRENIVLAWETRGPAWETPEVRKKLGQVFEKLDVTHVTDPFKIKPAYTSGIVYFRLHGLGERMYYYQYSNMEMQRLKELTALYEKEGKKVYVLFNNLSMFEDGVRFTEYMANGTFPKVTHSTGLASIKEVIEKTRYPTSKSVLIKKVGWRLVEVEKGKQARLSTFLDNLPSKSYKNADDLFKDLKSVKHLS
jgi:uncharacterized protein YecE (DUF72 family)